MIRMKLNSLVLTSILILAVCAPARAAKDAATGVDTPAHNPMKLYQKSTLSKDIANEKRKLRQTLSKNHDSPDAWRRLAEILYVEKNYGGCLEALENLLKLEPGDVRGNILLGEVFLARKEGEKAVAQFQKLTAMTPESAQARYKLGLAYMLAGDDASAGVELQKAVSLAPALAEAGLALAELKIKGGRMQEAVRDLENLIQKKPAFVPAYMVLGKIYLSKGDREKAFETFKKITMVAPKDPRGPYYMGIGDMARHESENAGKNFEKALTLDPGFAEALDRLVRIDLKNNDSEAALQRVSRQAKIVPNSFEIQFILGSLYQTMDRPDDAMAAFTKVLSINPGDVKASVELSRLLMEKGQFDDAIEVLERALGHRPAANDEQLLLMLMGISYEQMKDDPNAVKYYEKVIAANPAHAPALNNLAYIHLERFGDPETAHGYALRARKAAPDDPSIGDTVGWILYRKGDYQGALSLLMQNASRLPDSAEALYHLGMAHHKVGNQEEAKLWLRNALDLDTDFTGAAEAMRVLSELPAD